MLLAVVVRLVMAVMDVVFCSSVRFQGTVQRLFRQLGGSMG